MNVRIGLKIGKIEMEFEGSNEVFEAKIEPIMKSLIEFGKDNLIVEPLHAPNGSDAVKPSKTTLTMTVKSIASKFGVDSGGALLYASIASLAVFKGKETMTRQEINDEMKLAVGYYKPTYTGNLSSYLETLVKQNKIIEVSKDTYAVKDSERQAMEQKLAQ